jgi:hypothetical protein
MNIQKLCAALLLAACAVLATGATAGAKKPAAGYCAKAIKATKVDGRCAIAVLENATAHTYEGTPVKNTIIAAFRLSSSHGLGFAVTATPGSGSFTVPSVKFTTTCYAGWVEQPTDATGANVKQIPAP